MATEAQYREALLKAHRAGDTRAAQLFASKIKEMKLPTQMSAQELEAEKGMLTSKDRPDTITATDPQINGEYQRGMVESGRAVSDPMAMIDEINLATPQPKPVARRDIPNQSLSDVVGAGDAALSLLSSSALAIPAALQGAGNWMLTGDVEQARAGVQDWTSKAYQPRTELARGALGTIGEGYEKAASSTEAMFGPETRVGSEIAMGLLPIAGAARAIPAAAPVAKAAASKAATPARLTADKVKGLLSKKDAGDRSMGAAEIPIDETRGILAQELPVPIKLTKAQRTRDFGDQRFERETGKDPQLGAPIRERYAQQNEQIQQNFDAFIDDIGPESLETRAIGESVSKAVEASASKAKKKIKDLYKKAETTGEMEAPVKLDDVADHLNSSVAEGEVANIIPAMRKKAIDLGVAKEVDGKLVAANTTLKNGELFRKSVNSMTNADPVNIRQASIVKRLYDSATEGSGGNAYKQARQARARYANDYENVGVVKNILGTKRGSADRAVALEDTLHKSVIAPSASLDNVKHVRKILQTEGEAGIQAWKDIQAGVVDYIKSEATKNTARDQAGNPIVSVPGITRAIDKLDASGKLDFIFTKKGAEQLRTLKETASNVLTFPPGSVNASNTTSVLLGALDLMGASATGLPVPAATALKGLLGARKTRKIKKGILEHLE